ncbi:FAD-binding domain-containing protein [Pseudohyphozyma bogoriensis]|nr:FAD-binding domain-containing protein [Pseudohyphozyma bogoriensis]
MAALPFLSFLVVASTISVVVAQNASLASSTTIPPYAIPTFVTPGSSKWPSASAFASIGATPLRPWAAPCYSGPEANRSACAVVQNGYLNDFTRADSAGARQLLNWESCAGEECWLDSLDPDKTQTGTCFQGRTPAYSVSITSPSQAQAVVRWAIAHKVKMVIKNTGHEYLGRSSGPGTLQLWTHKLTSMTYSANFFPRGSLKPFTAITLGAGVEAGAAYQFATDHNKIIALGAWETVGAAGGFAQAGGHGPLGPTVGLAVDTILEYKLVVASGAYVTANAFTNSDLFAALRGGGGGSWGLLAPSTSSTLTGSAFMTDFLTHLASHSVAWGNAGWAGYVFVTPTSVSLKYVLPKSNSSALSDFTPFFEYFSTNSNYAVSDRKQTTFPSLQEYLDKVLFAPTPYVSVGIAATIPARLLPRSLFASATSQAAVVTALVEAQAQTGQDIQIYSTGPLNHPKANGALVNPAWRSALWHVVLVGEGISQVVRNASVANANAAANLLRALTPGGGCYYSEATAVEADWQTAFFGSNYAQLVSIKKKWDPSNILTVYKGVAWTGASDPAYSCWNQA